MNQPYKLILQQTITIMRIKERNHKGEDEAKTTKVRIASNVSSV